MDIDLLEIDDYKIGSKHLVRENIGRITVGYKIATILEIKERYIYATLFEKYGFKIIKFSRLTDKQFRPKGLKCYKLTNLKMKGEEKK